MKEGLYEKTFVFRRHACLPDGEASQLILQHRTDRFSHWESRCFLTADDRENMPK